ncbi:MAG TPA: DUF4097 family beta strand repeat-containing protein [Candidatus Dormibacteraeota bacterium]|nr:DUF4097 family beta strand repeat-containing protein [Candidatus Dormibacteraeota bacterium]
MNLHSPHSTIFRNAVSSGSKSTATAIAVRLCMTLSVIAAMAGLAPGAAAEEVAKAFTVSRRANVHVHTNDGSVRVSASDSNQVEFRVEYQGFVLNKDLRVDSRQDGDKVELTARVTGNWGMHWGRNSKQLHIEVRMPKDSDLDLETGDGSVDAAGISGTATIHTGDGSIKAQNLRGTVRLRTGDGSIEAYGLDGKVEATSGDGHIRLEGRFDALDIKTGDGSVDAHANTGSRMNGSWNIRTGDGSVDLVIPGDLQANIEASTGDGHISMGMPVTIEGTFSTSQLHGKLNGGGQPLTIHTGDGSIRLSKG